MSLKDKCTTCAFWKSASDMNMRCSNDLSMYYGYATKATFACKAHASKNPSDASERDNQASTHDYGEQILPDIKNPYQRKITKLAYVNGVASVVTMWLDVYDVAKMYKMSNPTFHAFKKLVDRGTGEKTRKRELEEAIASIKREIEMESVCDE